MAKHSPFLLLTAQRALRLYYSGHWPPSKISAPAPKPPAIPFLLVTLIINIKKCIFFRGPAGRGDPREGALAGDSSPSPVGASGMGSYCEHLPVSPSGQ